MKKDAAVPMTLDRFSQLLDAYGAEPSRWPAHERAIGELLVAGDARARALQNTASMLDAHLDAFEVAEPSAHLQARILEIPIRHQPQRARFRLAGWQLAALALVPCALGFVSGALTSDNGDAQDDGWSEVSALTLPGDVVDEEWP
jgi:predicted anti-sigma-YlaC factor YlaD